MLPSGIFVAFKINLHPWFDKNDFGHLILVFSMLFFYKPIKSYYIKTLNKRIFNLIFTLNYLLNNLFIIGIIYN